MYKSKNRIVYSASDLVSFLECEHSTSLDLMDLEAPLPRAPDDEGSALLHEKGLAHEKKYVAHLKASHGTFVDLSNVKPADERIAATIEGMRHGAEVIYQGALRSGALIGYPDFLRRVEHASSLGMYGYEVIVQLAAYSGCLAEMQGAEPAMMQVVLPDPYRNGEPA
jgi:predicted RecB family nuclease